MSPRDKPLAWLRGEVKTPPFSEDARIEAGFLLRRLQRSARKRMPMRSEKRKRLEQAGWTVADTGTFLELSTEERRFIETKLALAAGLRHRREHLGLTQTEAARRLGSSQSRVAKMEAADMTVSTDLLLRSLFRLGASRQDIARLLTNKPKTRAA